MYSLGGEALPYPVPYSIDEKAETQRVEGT